MPQDLRSAAQAALRAPRFKTLIGLMPREDRNSPRAMLAWLDAAAEFDRQGAKSAEYAQAHEALTRLAAAERMYEQASALYHSPALREKYGAAAVEAAWSNPAAAREALLKEGGSLSAEGHRALNLIIDAERLGGELGEAAEPVAVPTEAAQRDEYSELASQPAGGQTQEKVNRLNELYQVRLAAAEAATPSTDEEISDE